MPLVQPGQLAPHPRAERGPREPIHVSAEDVPGGVAGEGVGGQQQRVDQEDQGPESHPEPVREEERLDRVPREEHAERDHQPERVPVDVLDQEDALGLTGVALAGFANCAGRRRQEERSVVGLAVVVAGCPEQQREGQDGDGRRDRVPPAEDGRGELAGAFRGQARRIERRNVGVREIVSVLERGPRAVDDEGAEHHERDRRRDPPGVPAEGGRHDPRPFVEDGPHGHSGPSCIQRVCVGSTDEPMIATAGEGDENSARYVDPGGHRSS